MSLIAPLLSVPGRVRKLRGNNAPKLPAAESIAPTVTQAGNYMFTPVAQISSQYQINRLPQPYETHFARMEGTNNAVVSSEEVCNLTGKGAIYGAWMLYSGYLLNSTRWGSFSASIILDGVELVDQTWEVNSLTLPIGEPSELANSPAYGNAILVPLIGTMSYEWNYENTERVVSRNVVPLLKPLVFDESLEINLIHKESEAPNSSSATMRLFAAVYEDA